VRSDLVDVTADRVASAIGPDDDRRIAPVGCPQYDPGAYEPANNATGLVHYIQPEMCDEPATVICHPVLEYDYRVTMLDNAGRGGRGAAGQAQRRRGRDGNCRDYLGVHGVIT